MLDPAGDRASPAGSAHAGARTSAAKLAPMGWAADYRYARGGLYFVTAALYRAAGAAPARESFGLDWPGARLSLSDNPNPTALNNSCNRVYL